MTQLSKKVERIVANSESAAYSLLNRVTSAIDAGVKNLSTHTRDLNQMTQTINLSKGGNINLSKDHTALKKMHVGLGWDENQFQGADFDLDASALLLGADGKLISDSYFVYFRNLKSPCKSVLHLGDNLTGGGDGDDEVIDVDLDLVPAEVERIVFAVNIYNAEDRKQNFGMVNNAFIRLVDSVTNQEVARYDLTEDQAAVHAMVFAELYRHNGDWKFKAVGQGFEGSQETLGGILPAYR